MRQILIALILLAAGCEFKAPSNPEEQPLLPFSKNWPDNRTDFERCLSKSNRLSKCVKMGPSRRMRGVWYTGFEESGFVPDVDVVPLVRDVPHRDSDVGREFKTYLEIDELATLRKLGLPERDRCIRAIAIDFIGRQSARSGQYYTGNDDQLVVVDRLIGGRLIGKVRTRGLAGYDAQCATPAPSEAEMKAMDEADMKSCEASGHCIHIGLNEVAIEKN